MVPNRATHRRQIVFITFNGILATKVKSMFSRTKGRSRNPATCKIEFFATMSTLEINTRFHSFVNSTLAHISVMI